jgi:DNA-directed RNA polymerase subunit RPC12/RpoP
MFKCSVCGRLVEKLPEGRVRCPHCGSRVLLKVRPETVKKVKAK